MEKKKIILILVLVVLLTLGIVLVLNNKKDDLKSSDAYEFSKEYTEVGKDNVFVYKDIDEIINIMEKGTGIVYLGFPECPWCQTYVKYLNEVAKEIGIEKIYYYNILNDRQENTEEYKKIVKILEKELEYDNEGNKRIYVPNVSFHINGKLIGNDAETAYDTKGFEKPEDYWTETEIKELKTKLKQYGEEVKKELDTCSDCNV